MLNCQTREPCQFTAVLEHAIMSKVRVKVGTSGAEITSSNHHMQRLGIRESGEHRMA